MAEPVKPNVIEPSKGVSTAEAARTSAVIVKATEDDPALQNRLNQEPVIQSRIVWYGSFGVLASIGILFQQVGEHQTDFASYNMTATVGALLSLWSTGGTVYGRLMPGLKPMWHRTANWLRRKP